MTPEQKAVVLDYAQELQSNDEPWREFECKSEPNDLWERCDETTNPFLTHPLFHWEFRRKPRTITVTMPVPLLAGLGSARRCDIWFETKEDRDTALAAIRDAIQQSGIAT